MSSNRAHNSVKIKPAVSYTTREGEPMQDLITYIRLHREVGYGLFGAFFAALMAWHRDERLREIFWKAIVTAVCCTWIEDGLSFLSFPTKYSWFACVVIAYIGVDVILDKISSGLGFPPRKRRGSN